MTTSNEDKIEQKKLRAFKILKLLWKKFWRQKLLHRLITVFVMLLTLLWILIFYSSWIIWKIFGFVMIKVFLLFIEWYSKEEEKEKPFSKENG